MIIKNTELSKLNLINNKFILLHGKNDGLKNEKISELTNKKFLWFRNNLSTMISSLIDNTIFSIFAWIILNPNPLDFNTVLFTFILGTYILRIFIALFDTPFIYLAKFLLPNKKNEPI